MEIEPNTFLNKVIKFVDNITVCINEMEENH